MLRELLRYHCRSPEYWSSEEGRLLAFELQKIKRLLPQQLAIDTGQSSLTGTARDLGCPRFRMHGSQVYFLQKGAQPLTVVILCFSIGIVLSGSCFSLRSVLVVYPALIIASGRIRREPDLVLMGKVACRETNKLLQDAAR